MSPASNLPPGFTMDVPGGSATPNNPRVNKAALPPDPSPNPDDYAPAGPDPNTGPTPLPSRTMSLAKPPLPGNGQAPPAPQTQAANPQPPPPADVPPGFTMDVKPHYETPDEVAGKFDYSNSMLKHALPENVARQLVRTMAQVNGGYTAFADSAVDKALSFMDQHTRDMLMTYKPGQGSAEWANATAEYQEMKKGTEAEHPALAYTGGMFGKAGQYAAALMGAGRGIQMAEAKIGGPLTLSAISGVASQATKAAWPLIARAASTAASLGWKGAAAGAGYMGAKKFWESAAGK